MVQKSKPKHGYNSIFKNTWRVVVMMWPFLKWEMLGSLFLTFINSVLPYLSLGVFGLVVDEAVKLIKSGSTSLSPEMIHLLILQIIFVGLPVIITIIDSTMSSIFRFKFLEHVNLLFIKKMSELDIATLEDPAFNNILNTAQERGMFSIYNLWDEQNQSFGLCIGVISAAIILAATNWVFLVIAILGSVHTLIIQNKHGINTYWIWQSDSEQKRVLFNRKDHLMEKNKLSELQLMQNENYFFSEVKYILHDFTKIQVSTEKKRLISEMIGVIIFITSLGISIYLLISMTLSGAILVGTMTFIFGTLRGFQGTLSGLFKTFGYVSENNNFVHDWFVIYDTQPVIKESKNTIPLKLAEPPRIEFKNVWFKYPKTSKWILKDFSLIIEPEETLSVVGVNGAGKTTFVKLLNRIYDPTKGTILINGIDLKKVKVREWRSAIATLFQNYSTYSFPVKESIALGRTEKQFNMEQVVEAAQKAEAEVFIKELENEYEQMIGKDFTGGIELSVGQNQRLALSRVFYRDAFIVILDEPTSAIDAEAEAKIFENLQRELESKTVITISHRFSTVKKSDKICVIKEGKIHEYGSHKELMEMNGTYAGLYEKQASSYVEE